MRREPNHRVEQLQRLAGPSGTNIRQFRDGPRLIQCGTGGGWEHVSVSRPDGRTPTWEEMDRVKQKFWRDDEVVIQFHVNDSRKVNHCKNALHLWRPQSSVEMQEERTRWLSAGEAWPFDGIDSPGAVPLPPPSFV